MVGIEMILTQEAYTSKCSAIDLEPIKKHETYLGKRKKRGLFVTKHGIKINADCNGSVNIARLGLSVSGNEVKISDSLVSCVSQPKKVNVLSTRLVIPPHPTLRMRDIASLQKTPDWVLRLNK
jgi:transposase